jgi:CheY-like chemotaxis protein
MPEGGKLSVNVRSVTIDSEVTRDHEAIRCGDYVEISASDTGMGISPSDLDRVFEPFFTTKPIGVGTGLGLSMIHGFVRQSDGFVDIHTKVGVGTTVKIYLPKKADVPLPDASIKEVIDANSTPESTVILIVEDEPDVRSLTAEALRNSGYITVEADDGLKGLEVLNSGARIDMLLTDVGLPGLNGRQFADEARMILPDLKVLFMTGYSYNAFVDSNDNQPGMAVLTKPFSIRRLRQSVSALLSEADD